MDFVKATMVSKEFTTIEAIGDVYCFNKSCNGEKYKLLDCHKTTPRSIYGCRKCERGEKSTFRHQKMKHAFSFPKKMNLLRGKQIFLHVQVQSNKYNKKEMFNLYVDNKIQENIGDMFGALCKNEKCVYISTNKTSSFYD